MSGQQQTILIAIAILAIVVIFGEGDTVVEIGKLFTEAAFPVKQ